MKVYELISELQKFPAGADIVVGMHATLNAELLSVYHEKIGEDCGQVILTGGDEKLISEDGDELGYLSEIAVTGRPQRNRKS